jgi:nucleotide-binding universal stress UspA family protein
LEVCAGENSSGWKKRVVDAGWGAEVVFSQKSLKWKDTTMKNVLVALDFSDASMRVLDQAVVMAERFGADLTLIHVAAAEPAFVGYEPGPAVVRDDLAHQLRDEHRKLQAMEKIPADRGVKTKALLVRGYPAEKILSEAERLNAELIVLGSHGHGMLFHLVAGSVAEAVLKKARCPVLVVPARKSG